MNHVVHIQSLISPFIIYKNAKRVSQAYNSAILEVNTKFFFILFNDFKWSGQS